jgi:hypothetical protein
VVITPSKASSLPLYIPDWYIAKYTPAAGYSRPYTRFLEALIDEGVFFIDSASVCKSAGLTNTFPKTSTHWTKPVAFEICLRVIAEYERQTGKQIKRLASNGILRGENPPGFGSAEDDIFGIVYAGKTNELKNAIRDDFYYWPDAYTANETAPSIPRLFIQGGSFADDIIYYFTEYGIAGDLRRIRYNNAGAGVDWDNELITNFVILERNEQFVYHLGGSAPAFGQKDFLAQSASANIIDSLYEFLR